VRVQCAGACNDSMPLRLIYCSMSARVMLRVMPRRRDAPLRCCYSAAHMARARRMRALRVCRQRAVTLAMLLHTRDVAILFDAAAIKIACYAMLLAAAAAMLLRRRYDAAYFSDMPPRHFDATFSRHYAMPPMPAQRAAIFRQMSLILSAFRRFAYYAEVSCRCCAATATISLQPLRRFDVCRFLLTLLILRHAEARAVCAQCSSV